MLVATTALALAWLAPAGARAEPLPSIRSFKPCGSEQDLYLCGTLRDNGDLYLNGSQFFFPAKGTALVTWQGSIYCRVTDRDAGSAADSLIEYYLHLNLNEGQTLGVYNEPGSASVGERLNVRATTSDVGAARTMLVPLTLTRVFPILNKGNRFFRVWAKGDFRSVGPNSFCNVNGGAISVSYVPRP